MLKRKIEQRLTDYYKDSSSKILLIDGARQVGKTYIIEHTAKQYFKNYCYINLKEDSLGNKDFDSIKNTESFYVYLGINYPNLGDINNTIIFLDEIQVYPHLISLLKPLFKENKYRYIASGSLLGITLRHIFIPMGSVQQISMYPLDFEEFLWANNISEEVIAYLKNCFQKQETVNEAIHNQIMKYFKYYLISGGMPEAINHFCDNFKIIKCKEAQAEIYSFYKDDASQYDDENNLKIRRIYELMPSYMENKVKRIMYSKIDKNNRSDMTIYNDEFDYLIYSGCATKALAVSNPKFPLIEATSKNLIKLYYNDVGILTYILYKNNVTPLLKDEPIVNLGSVYETFVANELKAHGHDLFYFNIKKVGEVDFLINDYNSLSILPIEIKSGKGNYFFRALPKLVDPNGNYKLPKGYIFSNKSIIKREDNIYHFPIYLVMFL